HTRLHTRQTARERAPYRMRKTEKQTAKPRTANITLSPSGPPAAVPARGACAPPAFLNRGAIACLVRSEFRPERTMARRRLDSHPVIAGRRCSRLHDATPRG